MGALESGHQEDDQKVSEVSTTSKTSENHGKPRTPHDLETYVSFPGNLLKRTFMYIFSITKLLNRFPVSRFPGFRKPGNLQKCLKTQKLNGHLPDSDAMTRMGDVQRRPQVAVHSKKKKG